VPTPSASYVTVKLRRLARSRGTVHRVNLDLAAGRPTAARLSATSLYQPACISAACIIKAPAIPAPTCHAKIHAVVSYAVFGRTLIPGATFLGRPYSGNGYPPHLFKAVIQPNITRRQPVTYQPQTPSPYAYGTHGIVIWPTINQGWLMAFHAPKQD